MSPEQAQTSFRDPGGVVAVTSERVLRAVNADGRLDFEALSCSAAGQRLLARGDLISSTVLDLDVPSNSLLARDLFGKVPALLLEHERVPVRSYPYEWPPEMLHAAGVLTLRIARDLLDEELTLKDATPFNILFRGPTPVMVDVLSVARHATGDALWRPEAQFVRTFVIPLLLRKVLGIPPHNAFLASRDGITPEDAYRVAGAIRRLSPSFLRWVTLPTWLGSGPSATRLASRPPGSARSAHPEKARFILSHLFGRLERAMANLEPGDASHSNWSDYESCPHYDAGATAVKTTFVTTMIERSRPRTVLDVGCNVGRFSRVIAGLGASVVAIDRDPVVVGRLWRAASRERLDILPLVENLAMPCPATGWWNRECPSFLDRAAGRFDLLLMLAVVHHLLVTDRIPLDEIVAMAAHLTPRTAIVEYVGAHDPMFRQIARGRDHLYADLTQASFEAAWSRRFRLVAQQAVGDTGRILYAFERSG